jgi:hypothetical protein
VIHATPASATQDAILADPDPRRALALLLASPEFQWR